MRWGRVTPFFVFLCFPCVRKLPLRHRQFERSPLRRIDPGQIPRGRKRVSTLEERHLPRGRKRVGAPEERHLPRGRKRVGAPEERHLPRGRKRVGAFEERHLPRGRKRVSTPEERHLPRGRKRVSTPEERHLPRGRRCLNAKKFGSMFPNVGKILSIPDLKKIVVVNSAHFIRRCYKSINIYRIITLNYYMCHFL